METNKLITNKNGKDGTTVQAVDRALLLLKLIGENSSPISVKDLSLKSGLNRTTVWRLMGSLENEGFVEKDIATNSYQLGFTFYRLASQNNPYSSLIRRARSTLEALREKVGETVLLSVPKHNGILTIDQIDTNHSVRLVDYTNTVTPFHCTSNGKVLLSLLSKKELEQFLEKELIATSKYTITDPKLLQENLEWVRSHHVGLSIGEFDENENAISVPIFDNRKSLVAFLTLGGPSFRLSKEDLLNLKDTILDAAKDIERQLT